MARGRHLADIVGTYPNRLRELRLKHGKSLKTVAATLGVSAIHAGRLERGSTQLRVDQVAKLLEIIPAEPWDFFPDGPDRRRLALMAVFEALPPEGQDRLINIGSLFAKEAAANGDSGTNS